MLEAGRSLKKTCYDEIFQKTCLGFQRRFLEVFTLHLRKFGNGREAKMANQLLIKNHSLDITMNYRPTNRQIRLKFHPIVDKFISIQK